MPPKKVGRPPNPEPSEKIEVRVSPRLAMYLDDIRLMEGYGGSKPEIIRGFVWKEVNRLLENGRLKSREVVPDP